MSVSLNSELSSDITIPKSDYHGQQRSPHWKLLALGALGVVYGDIGTSPLYALRECFHGPHALPVSPLNVLGVLSLIFWALTLIISVKYLIFILRADNRGEGGILALTALLATPGKRGIVITLGLLGAAFLYADGMITPAISVLSAVEGLRLATPIVDRHVDFIAVAVLILLFMFQSRGTARVGALFGPLMLAWFCVLAVLGVSHVIQNPSVIAAINPIHACTFFQANGRDAFVILGTVFLVVTGGEALYADIGHFGTFPIRISWFSIVLPALVLNYFGQGALLLSNAETSENPFFYMAPAWALYPVIALATLAAIMASQAVITGSFSLTLQAIQLGLCPRLRIEHTSSEHFGQIYIPAVSHTLMLATIALVLGFRSSSQLAAAYGVAITITMAITTLIFFLLILTKWKWNPLLAILFAVFFLGIDLSFFGATLLKVFHGGWFSLTIAAVIYLLMSTWREGRRLLGDRLRESRLADESYVANLIANPPTRVAGTAVFLSGNALSVPLALHQNVIHNRILHDRNIILAVQTAEVPHVPEQRRLETNEIGHDFYCATLTYGFLDIPNVPLDIRSMTGLGDDVNRQPVSYFLGRETLFATPRSGMYLWRESLFAFMSRNAQSATLYFQLPVEQVVEIGVQVEL